MHMQVGTCQPALLRAEQFVLRLMVAKGLQQAATIFVSPLHGVEAAGSLQHFEKSSTVGTLVSYKADFMTSA